MASLEHTLNLYKEKHIYRQSGGWARQLMASQGKALGLLPKGLPGWHLVSLIQPGLGSDLVSAPEHSHFPEADTLSSRLRDRHMELNFRYSCLQGVHTTSPSFKTADLIIIGGRLASSLSEGPGMLRVQRERFLLLQESPFGNSNPIEKTSSYA